MSKDKIKKAAISVFYETVPHLIACTILSLFDPSQAGIIFIVGLVLPDFLVLASKATARPSRRGPNMEKIEKYPYLRYHRIRGVVKAIHVFTLLVSVVALFLGFPLIFFAGLSHIMLDLIGF